MLTGHGFFRDENFGSEGRGTLDDDLMETAWEELREELLAEWITKNPGTRPYAWWRYTSPERRRIGSMRLKRGRQRSGDDDDYRFVDDGKPHPFDSDERNTKVAEWRREYAEIADRDACRLYFGTPACLMTLDDFDAVYESEAEYIQRLGLFTDLERSAMAESNASEVLTGQPSES